MGKQRGGFSSLEALVIEVSKDADLNAYYNRYLNKAINKFPEIVKPVDKVDGPTTNSIMVIDMQNDFTWPHPFGAFSVADGINLVGADNNGPLVKWLDANIEKCTKVIFSRDSHDCEHCSFLQRNGHFPPHCQRNSNGSQMHASMKKYSMNPNVEVIFKGMDTNTESYGAIKYPNDDYLKKRQSGCHSDLEADNADGWSACSDATGGFYLNKNGAKLSLEDAFSDQPFTPGVTPGDKFSLSNLLGGQTTGQHNIFVVGLAGDYCVRDTAINLAKAAKGNSVKGNSVKINVFVIQPLTRYALVPMAVGLPVSLDEIKLGADKASGEVSKPLNQYAFKFDATIGKIRILSPKEIIELKAENIGGLLHFLTDPLPIVQNYAEAGVKMLREIPVLETQAGGSRRGRTRRRRQNKKNRKSRRR